MVKKLTFLDKKNGNNKLLLFKIINNSFYIYEKENKGSFISVETKLVTFFMFCIKTPFDISVKLKYFII